MAESFGAYLKRAREAYAGVFAVGMSASELARRCGVARSTITRLEADQSVPEEETVRAIAQALELDQDALLARAGYRAVREVLVVPDLPPLARVDRALCELGFAGHERKMLRDIILFVQQNRPVCVPPAGGSPVGASNGPPGL